MLVATDGILQPQFQGAPQDLLRQHTQGVYTTAVIKNSRKFLSLSQHLQRLENSALLLKAALGRSGQPQPTLPQIGAAVLTNLQVALRACQQDSTAQTAQSQALTVAMLHLTTWKEAQVPSPVLAGGWHVTVALKDLPRFPGWSIDKYSQAQIVGGPRWLWEAKNNRWASDRGASDASRSWLDTDLCLRKPLQDHLKDHRREGLLADGAGCLLEGLTSNLFVIAEVGPGEFEVQTAAVHHRVLEGIMRGHVMRACEHLRLTLRKISPDPCHASTWRAAFLTSSVRVMQPLDAIYAAADSQPAGHLIWQAAGGHHPVLLAIYSHLLTRVNEDAQDIFSCAGGR